ncbi:MAG: FAD-dependent oxidoreductase [Bacilli bacterium]|jgi:glycerol-3-phosphate dehydrogenase|nr:FAD-dependent oxidoreductase [Bacilli bacterium]
MNKLAKFQKRLAKKYPSFKAEAKDDCLVLTGETDEYLDKVRAGQMAAKTHYFYGVINDIKLKGYKEKPIKAPSIRDKSLDGRKVDVLVVGGGVVGCAILRELSKYDCSALLVEKEEDLAMGASSRNDGCVHVGIDLHKGSKKLKYLIRARAFYEQMCKDLDVPYRQDGQSVGFTNAWLRLPVGIFMRHQAKANRVPGGAIVMGRKKFMKIEPHLADEVKFGVYLPGGACTSPYELTVALGESAVKNGAKVSLSTIVEGMKVENHKVVSVATNRGTIFPRVVVNAAGTYSDVVAGMMGDRFFSIHPRKGTDSILDKAAEPHLSKTSTTVYPKLGEYAKTHSKGGAVMPTAERNALVGPDAVEVPDREDYSTAKESVNAVFAKQQHIIKGLSQRDIITYFSGVRAATYEEDFVVQKGKWTSNAIEAAGIQSPGLTAAPAIAQDVAKWAGEMLGLAKKKSWDPIRKGPIRTRELSDEERGELIKKNPAYGHIVCRCEEISEGEIVDAIHSLIPPTTVDGVKRRARAGMGRCQGGFCQPLVVSIMAREEKRDPLSIAKKGEGKLFFRHTKEDR